MMFIVLSSHLQLISTTMLFKQAYGFLLSIHLQVLVGGGPRVVVSTAAFHARVRGSVPGLGGLKETKLFLPHPRVKVSIVGSLRDREVACSASDRQGSNFESCVWRTVSSQSSHHPQEVLLAKFSLYVHKGGLKPDSFHFLQVLVTTVRCLSELTRHILPQFCVNKVNVSYGIFTLTNPLCHCHVTNFSYHPLTPRRSMLSQYSFSVFTV